MLITLLLILSIVENLFGPNVLLAKIQQLQPINEVGEQKKLSFEMIKYSPSAQQNINSVPLQSDAKVALIYDLTGKKVLYAKAEEESVPVASLTKLMTALVMIQQHSPEEIVTIPNDLPKLATDDQKLNIQPGEKFKLSDLTNAILIYSANDVANALAVWDSGSIENFSNKMNNYAKQWGLNKTNFTNPNGLDELNHRSSASDLLVLATILIQNEEFRKIINTQSMSIQNIDGKKYQLITTNKLLNLPYVYGIKTGFTKEAGQSLMLLAEKNGHQIITLVLNSPDRFTESNNMIKYTFDNYSWK